MCLKNTIFLDQFPEISKCNSHCFLKHPVKVCSTGISHFLRNLCSGHLGFTQQPKGLADTDIGQDLYKCGIQLLLEQTTQIKRTDRNRRCRTFQCNFPVIMFKLLHNDVGAQHKNAGLPQRQTCTYFL